MGIASLTLLAIGINKLIQAKFIKYIFHCSFVPFLEQQDDKISSLCHQRCNHESCDPACVLTGSLESSSGAFS